MYSELVCGVSCPKHEIESKKMRKMKRIEVDPIHLSSVLDHLTSTPMSPDLLSHKITIFIASLIIFRFLDRSESNRKADTK